MERRAHQVPSSPDVSEHSGVPHADVAEPQRELFPDLRERKEVSIDQLRVVSDPIVKTTRKRRNGGVVEVKEWFCHVRYQGKRLTPEPFDVCVLHATTHYEQVRGLRVKADDVVRVKGVTSLTPTPLGNGSDLLVHHIYLSDLAITRKGQRRQKNYIMSLGSISSSASTTFSKAGRGTRSGNGESCGAGILCLFFKM